MNLNQNLTDTQLNSQLEDINHMIKSLVDQYQGDAHSLLFILRNLESLHRQIREDLFLPSLPNTRKALYNLLKEMEEEGGWPYIERMRLQELLTNLSQLESIIAEAKNLSNTDNNQEKS